MEVCLHEVIWLLITMKMGLEMKNRSYIYDTITLGLDMDKNILILNTKCVSV